MVPVRPWWQTLGMLLTDPSYPRALPSMQTGNMGGAPNTELPLIRAWNEITAGRLCMTPLSTLLWTTVNVMFVGVRPPRVLLQTTVHPAILIGCERTLDDTLVTRGMGEMRLLRHLALQTAPPEATRMQLRLEGTVKFPGTQAKPWLLDDVSNLILLQCPVLPTVPPV